MSTYPNEIFKSVTYDLIGSSSGSLNTDANYHLMGTVVSINTATSTAHIRKVLPIGIDTQVYSFPLNSVSSDIYTNPLLGLQISGSNFYTYVGPAFNSGASAPFTYTSDTTAIATSSGLYSNHIIVPYLYDMMIATYDDNGQNGNIFFLLTDQTTYALSLVNMKTTANEASGNLQYLTDYSSYIIELNLNVLVSTFYIVWADDINMYNYTFLNSLTDHKNGQIIVDFTNPTKMSSYIYGTVNGDNTYTSNLYLWIYSSTGVTKYVLTENEDASAVIQSISINKEFAVEVSENVLVNSAGPSFEVTTDLKCVCQNTQVSEMICFYSTDACTFTVQTISVYCTPSLG